MVIARLSQMRVVVLAKVFRRLRKWRKLGFLANVFQNGRHSISTGANFCNSLFCVLPGALEQTLLIVAGCFSQILAS